MPGWALSTNYLPNSSPLVYETDDCYLHMTAEKWGLVRLAYLLWGLSLTTGSSSDSKAHTSHSKHATIIIEQGTKAVIIGAVWRSIFGRSLPWGKLMPFVCFGYKSVTLLMWWSHVIQSCFQKLLFVLLFKCEIYDHAEGTSVFPIPSRAKENKLKHFPFYNFPGNKYPG